MTGFVITGHNNFAKGILGAAELIVGKQKNIIAVDFLPEDNIDILDKKIHLALEELSNSKDIVIFADLVGGSPFNRSMIASANNKQSNIHVIGGVNLSMIIEALSLRDTYDDVKKLINQIIDVASESIRYGNKMLEDN